MKIIKNHIFDALIVVLFAAISFAYFYPADVEGKILYQHDASAGRGGGQEITEYREKTGEQSRWTGSVFSGMPTYQTAPMYDSQKGLNTAVSAYHLWLPENVWYVFVYLLGFYILLRAFDFKEWMAALGAIVWAFSSYFFIIIAAGHIWKVWALAYLPPMIAGIVLAFRKKYLLALLLTSLFGAFEIQANHVQMTYYYMFAIVLMVIAFIIEAAKKKEYLHIAKAIGVCVVSACIALMLNMSNLYHTWEYQKETMRGGSELVGSKKNDPNATTGRDGLDRDYITQWSYGISETWTLLVPNAKGGASMPMSMSETAMKKADPQFSEVYGQTGQYWGEQPGTSGPVYIGAFVCLLFVLGLIVVKGPLKWTLLAATIISILLSWGKNFMPLTDFFIDYFPMYSKFRTVASILVIAEFTMPLLAMFALKKVVEEPECLGKNCKWLWVSTGITAGIAALFAVAPGMLGSVISSSEMASFQQIPEEYRGPLMANLIEMREAVLSADAWRSVFIILIGVALVFAYIKKWIKAEYMTATLIVVCLVDMWQVNKRYLNNDMFVEKTVRETAQPMTAADKQILEDKSDCGNYRVLNFASNTFNENETSYYHKSIGGYHAAKLQRYQEMINHYIAPQMQKAMSAVSQAQGDMEQVNGDSVMPVLNMLNMRYMILPLQDGGQTVLKNPHAMGNAWFVNKVEFVENANNEIDGIANIDLHTTAIADKKFAAELECAANDSVNGTVQITSYAPNHLIYDVEADKKSVLVFSEVYYPGWTATVDGQEVPVGRVDYILRAIVVPQGKHKVELMFFPKSVDTTETMAYVGYALLLLVLIAVIFKGVKAANLKKN